MGYSTRFEGEVGIDPPLNAPEAAFLRQYAETRHVSRTRGPYYLGERDDDIIDRDRPFPSQPSLYCQWVPTPDGTALRWDGQEKFYESARWMKHLIEFFLMPDAKLRSAIRRGDIGVDWELDPLLGQFTYDHVCNGIIRAEGQSPADRWFLIVRNNKVLRAEMVVQPGAEEEVE